MMTRFIAHNKKQLLSNESEAFLFGLLISIHNIYEKCNLVYLVIMKKCIFLANTKVIQLDNTKTINYMERPSLCHVTRRSEYFVINHTTFLSQLTNNILYKQYQRNVYKTDGSRQSIEFSAYPYSVYLQFLEKPQYFRKNHFAKLVSKQN